MQHQFEILRFKEGAKSRHPSPEATVAAVQPDVLADDAGSQIAVLVDLTPQLPYRSREIRTLVVKTYWSSTGSIVARLRRALAAANRHLVAFNQKAPAGNKCSGSLTCAVFSGEELFLGQVGAAYAFVLHPTEPAFELFPKRDRLLIPLGGTVPPIIHIGYTVMSPGSVACLATTRIAEAKARETWQNAMSQPKLSLVSTQMAREIASGKLSGSVILMRAQASSSPIPVPKTRSDVPAVPPADSITTAPRSAPAQPAVSVVPAPQDQRQTVPPLAGDLEGAPIGQAPAASTSGIVEAGLPQPQPAQAQPTAANLRPAVPTSRQSTRTELPKPNPAPSGRTFSPPPVGAWWQALKAKWQARSEARKGRVTSRSTTAERARLRQALRTLLPGKVEGTRRVASRTPPPERAHVLAGLTLGLFLVVVLITLSKYFQLGGPLKAESLLVEAKTQLEQAYVSLDPDSWYQLKRLADQVVALDPQNAEALSLKAEVDRAIDALENAALLNVTQLLDLGTAPRPRRMLVAGGWLYILNTATDSVLALPLDPTYLSSPADSPTTILRKGQTYNGAIVNHLVDFAWIPPGGNFLDGAVIIYSEGGTIFIYEPALGPGSTTTQAIQGDLAAGNVTHVETFGENLYLVNRQQNQVLLYEPVNGIYHSARPYYAEGSGPDLQLTLDIAIDGRIYLLMGDGSLQTFFAGSPDHSFTLSKLPEADLMPTVMAMEADPENGLVYLADSQYQRIFVVNKRGEFQHQFRLQPAEMKRIEALAIHEHPPVLYVIADNKLYAAPIPIVPPR